MESKTMTIKELFSLNSSDSNGSPFFDPARTSIQIPLYQREYKWKLEKAETLINDISNANKFIGIIFLDAPQGSDYYEIVDGQQRVTTLFLALICLYNFYQGKTLQQESIERILKKNGSFILKNESIAGKSETGINDFIKKISLDDPLLLDIRTENDIYNQKEIFANVYKFLAEKLATFTTNQAKDFKNRLLESTVVVIVNNEHLSTHPIERIFLDINEKAQVLDAENIFKGHCFENYEDDQFDQLKALWVELKSYSVKLESYGFGGLNEFLYLYLLQYNDQNITSNLTLNKVHVLEGMGMDDNDALLKRMITYCKNTLSFIDNIGKSSYIFDDLCPDCKIYSNCTFDFLVLRTMATEIVSIKSPLYQKLPLLRFVNECLLSTNLQGLLTFDTFKRIITNLYIYAQAFALLSMRKSKQLIDFSLGTTLNTDSVTNADIVTTVKTLRKSTVSKFEIPQNYHKFEPLSFIYSVIDNFDIEKNWLSNKYFSSEMGYNREHFIVPDNSKVKITWHLVPSEQTEGTLRNYLVLLFDEDTQKIFKEYKKRTINYLIMDTNFNGDIKDGDIVYKIDAIKRKSQETGICPKHFSLFIEHIEQLPTYKVLQDLKGSNEQDLSIISDKYKAFIAEYFSDTCEFTLRKKLQDAFGEALNGPRTSE